MTRRRLAHDGRELYAIKFLPMSAGRRVKRAGPTRHLLALHIRVMNVLITSTLYALLELCSLLFPAPDGRATSIDQRRA